jgi:restriction system protein
MEVENSKNKAWKIRVDTNNKEHMSKLHECEVVIDYSISDLSPNLDKRGVIEIITPYYLSSSSMRLQAHAGQIFCALTLIRSGDLIIVPINSGRLIHLGKVISDKPLIRDTIISRRVEWLRENIPRSHFDQDLQYSFMAIMKLCEVRRNNAFERLSAMSNGDEDPGY